MTNPFPGMNPFLERHWGDVHTSLVAYARNDLNHQLPEGLAARVQEQVRLEVDERSSRRYSPDVRVVTEPVGGTGPTVSTAGVQVAEPIVVSVEDDPRIERNVVIVDNSTGGRVVTSIEFLSPTNKLTSAERERFRVKQERLLAGGTSIVEVDLIRQGEWTLHVPLHALPPEFTETVGICVVRAWNPGDNECYPLPLQERLPAIRIPLRETDPDAVLDVQALLDRAWDDGRYAIDYTRQHWPRLTPDGDVWVRRTLIDEGFLPPVDSA